MATLAIDKRFEGLPGVSHGGYIAGLVAKRLGPSVSVTLTRAVRPGSTVVISHRNGGDELSVEGVVAATALADDFPTTAPRSITDDDAERASQDYLGFTHHFFPRCMTCGPDVAMGEGLRVFPGPVDGRGVVACVWRAPQMTHDADGTVASEFLWAALDCSSIWGHIVYGESQLDDRAVSGRLALHQLAPVPANRPSVVMGWPIERQARKVITGAGIYSDRGELLVEARQTMILTARGVPLHVSAWGGAKSTTA